MKRKAATVPEEIKQLSAMWRGFLGFLDFLWLKFARTVLLFRDFVLVVFANPFPSPFINYLSYEHASLLVLLKPFSPLKSLYPAIAATRCRCPRPCWSTWNWAKTAPGYPQGILYIYYFIAITI